ncbi:MAG: hypothetical protein J5I53_08830 [Bradyrhizobiaceae bacterium]|nr:hypothetical protein [Bradyrhizobiaceae bacterium]
MTNDELLSGYLDGTLTNEQMLEFEARRSADPAFAAEVDDMVSVENLLRKGTDTAPAPVGFLQSVESSMVAKIAAASVGAVGIGHFLSSSWGWIASAGVVAVGGGAVYLALQSTSPAPKPAPVVRQQPVVSQQVQAPQVQSPITEPTSPKTTPKPQPQAPDNHVTPVVPQQQISKSATAEANSPNSVLAELESDYAQCVAQKKTLQCAQIALQIGNQYRQRNNLQKATEYLNAALQQARTARIVQYQVAAHGSLGLVARDGGNTAEARLQLSKAIELARSAGLAFEEYQEALDALR